MRKVPDINCIGEANIKGSSLNVCLDQCAISQLAISRKRNSAIDDLRDLMRDASQRGRLVCPVAPETIVETTALPLKCRRRIHELHCYLAGARDGGPLLAFKSMGKMINEETLALAKSNPFPSAFEVIHWQMIDDDRIAHEVATEVKAAKCKMEQRADLHQVATNCQYTLAMPPRDLVMVEHASHVYRQVQRLLRAEELWPEDHMGYDVCQYLLAQGITKPELMKLREDILQRRWEEIPVIVNRARLSAQLEAESIGGRSPRRYRVNDEFDIPRLSVGLASADVVITDAAMAQLCRTVKTQQWTHAKVFSVRETKDIVNYLNDAIS